KSLIDQRTQQGWIHVFAEKPEFLIAVTVIEMISFRCGGNGEIDTSVFFQWCFRQHSAHMIFYFCESQHSGAVFQADRERIVIAVILYQSGSCLLAGIGRLEVHCE